jgi:hypothetical protein
MGGATELLLHRQNAQAQVVSLVFPNNSKFVHFVFSKNKWGKGWTGGKRKGNFFCRFPEMGWGIPYKRWWREARRGRKQQQSNKNPLHLWKDAFFLLRSPPNTGTSFAKKMRKPIENWPKFSFLKPL